MSIRVNGSRRAALAAGHFYASTGPELPEVRLDSRELRVRCSPCLAIHCLSFGPRNAVAFDKESVAAGRGLAVCDGARVLPGLPSSGRSRTTTMRSMSD